MGLNKYCIEKILQYRIWFQNNQMTPNRNKGDIIKYGYTCYSDHYDAVLYLQNGVISYFPTSQNFHCISFGFSGCYMARFSLQKRFFVAHIPPDAIKEWNAFLDKHLKDNIIGCIFNPQKLLKYEGGTGRYPGDKVWGVITNRNVCIAIKVYENYERKFNAIKHSCTLKQLGASNIDMNSIIRKKISDNKDLHIY
ncbi:MAG: hypothetical protein RRZ66_12105 [Bacteroidales bacterium]